MPAGGFTKPSLPATTETVGESVTFTFRGTKARAYGTLENANGSFEVYIDGKYIENVRLSWGGPHAKLYQNMMMYFQCGKDFYEIDGNMGTAAGMTEMLVQSHRRTKSGEAIIDLLPALPSVWPTGSVKGLRARGAFEVDIEWEDGKLVTVMITSLKGTPLTACYNGKTIQMKTAASQTYTIALSRFEN